MRCFALTTAFWALAGFVVAVLVVGLGLYNVSARQGHLPGVSWILHTAYHNSVKLRAPPESTVPDLSRPGLAALGAKHFESACRFCHAAPGELQRDTVRAMVPHPPRIDKAVEHWQPRHLFWIVRNGVKMSGMPAWPSAVRDNDVWAVVAFLEQVRGMDAQGYDALIEPAAHPPPDGDSPRPERAAYCASCHDAGTERANAFIPRLDIQNANYLKASLIAYRNGSRHSGIMQHAASTLSDREIEALARYFASSAHAASGLETAEPSSQLTEEGERLASGAGVAADLPACAACHGPWPQGRSAKFPNLAGQHEKYLLQQLQLWKSGKRGGGGLSHLMHKVVPDLDEDQMRALAAYYAGLAPQDPEASAAR